MTPSTKSSSKPKPNRLSFEALGTFWDIEAFDKYDLNKLQTPIFEIVELFDQTFSRFRDDSLVSKISLAPGQYNIPADFYNLLSLYEKLYAASGGLCTPLIGKTLESAGYDKNYSFKPGDLSKPPDWNSALKYTKHSITLTEPVLLDFGAAGKGYLVDKISKLLDANKVFNYCVDGSGDLRYQSKDSQPLRVGLEHPKDPKQIIGFVDLHNQSLCASAGNRRAWGKYHHILNPKTLSSPKSILATWTVTDDTALADGLATALFLSPIGELSKAFKFEYVVLYKDMTADVSSNFPGEIFAKNVQ